MPLPSYKAYQEKLQAMRDPAAEVLILPGGQKLVELLEARFVRGDIVGDTVEETYFNLGAREVALFLRSVLTNRQEKPNV